MPNTYFKHYYFDNVYPFFLVSKYGTSVKTLTTSLARALEVKVISNRGDLLPIWITLFELIGLEFLNRPFEFMAPTATQISFNTNQRNIKRQTFFPKTSGVKKLWNHQIESPALISSDSNITSINKLYQTLHFNDQTLSNLLLVRFLNHTAFSLLFSSYNRKANNAIKVKNKLTHTILFQPSNNQNTLFLDLKHLTNYLILLKRLMNEDEYLLLQRFLELEYPFGWEIYLKVSFNLNSRLEQFFVLDLLLSH